MVITTSTSIHLCKKCNLRTRHERQEWERKTLLTIVGGRTKKVAGWQCTKCGRRQAIR